MYLLIVVFPLLGSLCAGLFGRYVGARGAALITTSCIASAACLSACAFYEVAFCQSPCYITFSPWFVSGMFDAQWGFLFDTLTVVMLCVITFVSTLVHVYSIGYMAEDPHVPRFMSYISIFTFFMIMLVTGDNFLQLFLGWEGVGLASYLLINFWFTRIQANKSAIKAMLVNRVGDFGLALGIMGIFTMFGTVEYAPVFASAHTVTPVVPPELLANHYLMYDWLVQSDPQAANVYAQQFNEQLEELRKDPSTSHLESTPNVDYLYYICILLFIGAVGKSAQCGLHVWLPDAMEGPTPVSALIHAATMVTAGVFLLARCSPLFECVPHALDVVAISGALTCFFAATTGLVQNDMKRVIAYSTCSQLGYMIFVCGLSQYAVGVFHLMNHAFFKALLFLSAGSVIHAMSDEQDMRRMGGIHKVMPLTYSMMIIGTLALIGFPFLAGFYSKDCILEVTFAGHTYTSNFTWILGTLSAFCTSFYSWRLLFFSFTAAPNGYKHYYKNVHESAPILAIPLMILAIGSIFIGYMFRDAFIGLGSDFWNNAIYVAPHHQALLEAEFMPEMRPLMVHETWMSLLFFVWAGSCIIDSTVFGGTYIGKRYILFGIVLSALAFVLSFLPLEVEKMCISQKTLPLAATVGGWAYAWVLTREPDERLQPLGIETWAAQQWQIWDTLTAGLGLAKIEKLIHMITAPFTRWDFYYRRQAYAFLNRRWLFDTLYNRYLSYPAMRFGYNVTFVTLDKGLLEHSGPLLSMSVAGGITKLTSDFHSGQVSNYIFVVVASFVILIIGPEVDWNSVMTYLFAYIPLQVYALLFALIILPKIHVGQWSVLTVAEKYVKEVFQTIYSLLYKVEKPKQTHVAHKDSEPFDSLGTLSPLRKKVVIKAGPQPFLIIPDKDTK